MEFQVKFYFLLSSFNIKGRERDLICGRFLVFFIISFHWSTSKDTKIRKQNATKDLFFVAIFSRLKRYIYFCSFQKENIKSSIMSSICYLLSPFLLLQQLAATKKVSFWYPFLLFLNKKSRRCCYICSICW